MVKRADGLRVISLDTNLCEAKCLAGLSTDKLVYRAHVRDQWSRHSQKLQDLTCAKVKLLQLHQLVRTRRFRNTEVSH
jgi:hypothetical protein